MSTHRLPASLRETIDAFDETSGHEPLTTTEVAERLGLGRRSTYTRLQRLVDAGELQSKKVGARGRVWWRPGPPRPDGEGDSQGDGEGDDAARNHGTVDEERAPGVISHPPTTTAQQAAFASLEGVFREVIDGVVDQSTRAEIERTVCAQLVDSAAYRLAWVGAVDARTRTVAVRTVVGDGTFLGTDVPIEPGRERQGGPARRAIETRELQVESADGSGGDGRGGIGSRGDGSGGDGSRGNESSATVAAVPIVHEGTSDGVLVVQAEREGAFTDDERALVSQLGAVVGHAVAATERKRALMSDEVIELGFAITDVFETLGAETTTEGTIVLEATIPLGDDDYLIYGSTPAGTMPAVEAIVASEELPDWESVTHLGDEGDRSRFELRLTQPPLFAAVAEAGGYIAETRIEGGDFSMAIQLPPGADVRRVVGVITDSYPDIELVTQRQVTRKRPTAASLSRDPFSALTEAQRAAIEAAYRAGYFDWPREQTGEEVASSLSISASTFHQHVRKAQARLLEELFEAADAAGTTADDADAAGSAGTPGSTGASVSDDASGSNRPD